MNKKNFKGKHVLIMGLGLLGGGVATTKWFVRHGANVTVTDLRTKKILTPSIKKLGVVSRKVKFVLGRHDKRDFMRNEIVVVNPGVPRDSMFLSIARRNGARLVNEASIFFDMCKNPIVAVTGTRGKTTTVNWIAHLLRGKYHNVVVTGNSSEKPMLEVLDGLDGKSPVVVELSSWHLELLPESKRAPDVAVITNIYPDHLNRYSSIRAYASAKANIFLYQKKHNLLILSKKNIWTPFFLKQKPDARIQYIEYGISIPLRRFKELYGSHNMDNISVAIHVARHFGLSKNLIERRIWTVPQIPFREEVIYKNKTMQIVNDTTATSPDGTIAALKRFGKGNGRLVLIAGGTDKNLHFLEWARLVKRFVKLDYLFLLEGSATSGMIKNLKKVGFENIKNLFSDPTALFGAALKKFFETHHGTLLFSPGAASFEKFKNEFDRGEKFNVYCKKFLASRKPGGRK